MDNNNSQSFSDLQSSACFLSVTMSFGDLQPSACFLRATMAILRLSEQWSMFDMPQKTAPVKVYIAVYLCGGTMVFCYKAID